MCTPALYLCRSEKALTGLGFRMATVFAHTAWFGAIVEAWSDAHKFWAKRGKDGSERFTGPRTWWYGASRHPNYLGEIVFWGSVLGSGFPAMLVAAANRSGGSGSGIGILLRIALGTVLPCVCSGLGISGIIGVMLGATKRLEGKQTEKYGGQEAFEEWKSETSSLFVKPQSLRNVVLPVIVTVVLAVAANKATSALLFG